MSASPVVWKPKPVVVSPLDANAGAALTEVLSCPVMGVEPLAAIDPVSAVAISEKSLLTADDEITVFGTKGA